MTLIELVVAVALIGIGVLASVEAFKGISKSIQTSKTKSLATNIAQEKMQIVMQKSYYEILVTTATAYRTDFSPPIAYDPSYYPPETISEGGVTFTRLTYIEVVQEICSPCVISWMPPSTPDTGMRRITVTVIWNAPGGNKSLVLKNFINNPNTVMSNVLLSGNVRNAATLTGIPNALVNAAENIGWRDTTDASGNFRINLVLGSFNFQASAPGYYSSIVNLSVGSGGTSYTFSLGAISTGTIKGTAWLNNHPVISQVVSSTGPLGNMEYVNLYNPTTAAINMGTTAGAATPNVWTLTFDASGGFHEQQLVYVSTYIPSYGFFLITNTGDGLGGAGCAPITIKNTTLNPDACWRNIGGTSPNYFHALQCNDLSGGGGCSTGQKAGGVVIGTNGGVIWTGLGTLTRWDSLAWSGSGVAGPGITPTIYETLPSTPSAAGGMVTGEVFLRRLSTGTAWNGSLGNAYDTNYNNVDFLNYITATFPFAPRTTATRLAPLTGTPATGAIVSVTDGLSAPSSATLYGVAGNTSNPPYAQFLVPGVATGTWIMFVDSGSASVEIGTVAVVGLSTTSVPNAVTFPAWLTSSGYSIVLGTSGVTGMISGRVLDVLNNPISGGITVAAGGMTTTSSANGSYYLRVATGTYDVVANPNNANASYSSFPYPGVVIGIGDLAQNVDFSLPQGGKIRGWISRDGTNALPGVAVAAKDSGGSAHDTQVSAANGEFTLVNLTTGSYSVEPILDSRESSSPAAMAISVVTPGLTVIAGTFTVTGALGTVVGTVKESSQPIRSGVLIVVTTTTLTLPLPALSTNSLTTAAFYADTSNESGTFAVDVRGSTTSVYNVSAFYMRLSGQTPLISSKTVSNVTVTAGQNTSSVDFAW